MPNNFVKYTGVCFINTVKLPRQNFTVFVGRSCLVNVPFFESEIMRILGIETSCDETGIAIYDDGLGDRPAGILAHRLYSQIAVHADYGGVVPELASRDHVRKTIPLITEVLADAKLTPADLDGVAYTAGPGLVGALLVGCAIGRSLAYGCAGSWTVTFTGASKGEERWFDGTSTRSAESLSVKRVRPRRLPPEGWQLAAAEYDRAAQAGNRACCGRARVSWRSTG
jgi:hypothetical protein